MDPCPDDPLERIRASGTYALLRVPSDHSAGHGASTVEQLVDRAHAEDVAALALTDVETLRGQPRFHRAARERGIRPLTGVELRAGHGPRAVGAEEDALVLLARDRAGYESLCRIVSRRAQRGGPTPAPLACLADEPRGIVFLATSATTVRALVDAGVAADDVRFLAAPGTRELPTGIAAVADPGVLVAHEDDADLRAMLAAIHRRAPLDPTEAPRIRARAWPDRARMRELSADARWVRWLEESVRLAETCGFDVLAPDPPLADPGAADALASLCRRAFLAGQGSGRWRTDVHERRLADELAFLDRAGLSSYLLEVAELARHTRSRGIAVLARGSAAGSLVVHVLGLSAVDPVEEGLFFERFVHPGRTTPPDIDLDLPSTRREEVVDWVLTRGAPDNAARRNARRAARVGAHVTFGPRGALRHGLRALGFAPREIDRFCATLPPGELPAPAELAWHELAPSARASVPLFSRLSGRFQHVAAHASAVVLGERALELPLELAAGGAAVTQFDGLGLELLGARVVDLLGSRTLSAIERAHGELPEAVPPQSHDDRDPVTLALLQSARTIGCAEIETPAVRSVLRRMPMRGVRDLATALALVRPGAAAGAAKAAFLRRARGVEAARPIHPELAPVLRATHGLLVFEEDLIAAAMHVTGWTAARAEDLRARIVLEAGDDERLRELSESFVDAATARGLAGEEARTIWQALARLSAYTFSKAHAASHAVLAWQAAWWKSHHPAAFACGVLQEYGGAYPRRTIAADFARAGVRLLVPDVQRASETTRLEDGAVWLGLSELKHLRRRTRERLTAGRPFRDVGDLVARAAPSRRELEALVLVGACDALPPLVAAEYPLPHERLLAGQAALPDHGARLGGPGADTYRALVRVYNELRFLSLHASDHPMRILREEAREAGCATSAELERGGEGEVRFAGLVAATHHAEDARGRPLLLATLEDETGTIECTLAPREYAVLGSALASAGPFLCVGRAASFDCETRLTLRSVEPFHLRPQPYASLRPRAP
jgi:DNA polymerase III alpha subunit